MSLEGFDPSAPAQGDGVYGLPFTPEEAKVVLLPVPWEPTTSYRKGTARGPAAILEASKQVDLFDGELGRFYEHGVAMLPFDPEIEEANRRACESAELVHVAAGHAGGDATVERALDRVNELSAWLNDRVRTTVRAWLERGQIVGLVGGDHSTPFGSIAAHADHYGSIGVLHVDAHADLREAYEGFTDSHASILYNVAQRLPKVAKIVQVGIRDYCEEEHDRIRASNGRIVTYFDARIAEELFEGRVFARIAEEIVGHLPREVYVTFDIDGLDPSLCPHTGTPVPGGLSYRQALHLLGAVVASGRRIVGFDLNEVAPGPAGDEWDGNVGARLLYKMIGLAITSATRTSA